MATTTLKFFSVDTAGNAEAVRTESYTLTLPSDTTAPTTTASPKGGSYPSAQNVTLTCADNTGGSGCATTYYTRDGSTPTTASPQYTGPLSIVATTTLKFFSVDAAGNAEAVRTESYTLPSDTTAPTTTASPAGGSYTSIQSVTLTCTDTAGGSGCAGTYYTTDGSTPTTASPQYTGALTISVTTELKFFSADTAGNLEAVRTEKYTLPGTAPTDSIAPTTTASPAGGSYTSAQSVTLTCTDNAGGSGCANTYYTLDGSTPNTGSAPYTTPLSIGTTTTLRFLSTDKAGNTEAFRSEVYYITVAASTQLAAIRAAADGPIDLPLTGAVVTYVKPLVGNDPAGFFLQAESVGPAVFVAVSPTALSPAPAVGDRVSLTAEQKATVNGQVRVTSVGGYSRTATGVDTGELATDVSNIDLVAKLGDYESELIFIYGTLNGTFTGSGSAHVSVPLATNGVVSPNQVLRLPTALQDEVDLSNGCNVVLRTPLWRFADMAQASLWSSTDLVGAVCPAPRVVSAKSTSDTALTVTFDRKIAPGSLIADGSQFTFTGGLTASAAVAVGREVRLTTGTQTGGASYQVTAATSLMDIYGSSLDAAATTASFTGYQTRAVLRITEVAPTITSGRDLIELVALSGGSVDQFTLTLGTTVLATLPNVQVAAGDVIVIHIKPDASNGDAASSELTGKAQFPAATYAANYNTAWDFHGTTATDITYSSHVLRIRSTTGETQDGVSFGRTGTTPPADFYSQLESLQAEGQWLPANCGGAVCSATSTPTAQAVSADWSGLSVASTRTSTTVRRTSTTDTHRGTDWAIGAQSLGTAN